MMRSTAQIAHLAGVLAIFVVAGCSRQQPDERWMADSVNAEAAARYEAAADYSREHDGLALLVYDGSELVFSAYQNGFGPEDATLVYSGTKSFSCALAVAAIEDGIISGFDERVSETLTDWADDPRRSKITVRHMLYFVTGLERSFGALNFGLARDKYALAVEREGGREPGTYYHYGPVHLTAFGAYFLAKTGEDPLAYLERRVFEPIGMTYADWQRDRAGHPFLAKGASLRAEEWAKFGHLVLARGEWEGEQVLDPDLLDECFVPGPDFPGYGMTWWMNVPIGDWASRIPNEQVPVDPLDAATPAALITPAAPADLVAAAGHKDNRLYISRSANLVVVRLADGHRKFRDAAFLDLLFKP